MRTDTPAFPRPSFGLNEPADGMSLRDYFAAKAMQMHMQALSTAASDSPEQWNEMIAKHAYATADAMLAARG